VANKEILIVAGPNGAGKTTFALTYLRVEARGLPFLNADMIAAGLAPFGSRHSDIHAGRLMLAEMDRLVAGHPPQLCLRDHAGWAGLSAPHRRVAQPRLPRDAAVSVAAVAGTRRQPGAEARGPGWASHS